MGTSRDSEYSRSMAKAKVRIYNDQSFGEPININLIERSKHKLQVRHV